MKNVSEIKVQKEQKISQLLKEFGVFFAFSNEQFTANKAPLKDGDKYVSMGMGGYIPKSNLNTYLDKSEAINKWYKKEVRENRQRRQRLEYLRKELRAERISYGELAELQSLAPYIESGDVELLEAAGVPENIS